MRSKKRIIIEAAAGIAVLAIALLVGLPHFRSAQSTWTIRGSEGEIIHGIYSGRNCGSVAYAPDGNMLAVPTAAGIFIWDINWNRNKPRYFLQEYLDQPSSAKQIRSIAISRDGNHVLDGQHDGTVRVYDVLQEKLLYKLDWPFELDKKNWGYTNSEVMCLAFSPDGKQAAIGYRSGLVRVLDVETGEERCSFDFDELYNPANEETPALLKFSPDGNSLLIAHSNRNKEQRDSYLGDHCLVDLNNPSQVKIFTQVKSYIQTLAFMPDGKTYCTLSTPNPYLDNRNATCKIQTWDIQTGEERNRLSLPQLKGAIDLHIEKGGVVIAVYDDNSEIIIRNETNEDNIWQRPADEVKRDFWALRFTYDSKYLIVAGGYAYRDPETAKIIRYLNADLNYPNPVSYWEISADGHMGVGMDRQSRALVCADFINMKMNKGDVYPQIDQNKFCGNGNRLLVTANSEDKVHVLETPSLKEIARLKDLHIIRSRVLELSYDGSLLLVAQAGGGRLIDVETGETIRTLQIPSPIPAVQSNDGKTANCDSMDFSIDEAVFHPDGKRLISNVAYDRQGSSNIYKYYSPLQVWDIQTGELIKTIEMDNRTAFFAISPNGRWLTASSSNGKLYLIDLESGRRYVRDSIGHSIVIFSPDGSRVLVNTGHSVQQVWDFEHLLSTCQEAK